MPLCRCRHLLSSASCQMAILRSCSCTFRTSRGLHSAIFSSCARTASFQRALLCSARALSPCQSRIFSHPSPSSHFFSPTSTEYIFGLTATTSFIACPPHSSFILPKPSCFRRCTAGYPWGSCLCRTSMSFLACLCTRLLSGCPR